MSVDSKVITNTWWNALNTVGGLLFGLITSIVLARMLGPSLIGQFHYWIWLSGLLILVSSPGLAQAMTKFGAELLGRQDRQTASVLFAWLLFAELALGGLVVSVTLLFAWAPWESAPPSDPAALILIAITVVPGVLERLFLAAAKGTQEFRTLSQSSLIGTIFYAVCAIAVASLGFGIHALLLAILARRIVTLVLIGRQLPSHYTVRGAPVISLPPELSRRILLYCRDVTLILVIDTILYERSELFFLSWFAADAEIAFYSQSFDLAMKAMSIPAMFSGVLLPTFSSLAGQRNGGAFSERFNSLHTSSYRVLALIAMPIGLGAAAITPAFALLYGPDFLPMAPVLSILLVGNIVGALASVSATVLHSADEQSFIVRLGFVAAVLNIGLDLALISKYGAVGAAFANSISQLVSGVAGIAYSVRRLNLTFPLRSIARIALAALAAAAVAGLISSWFGGLVLAIAAGILVYPLMLRAFTALDASDHALLSQIKSYLPTQLGPAYQSLVDFLAPQS